MICKNCKAKIPEESKYCEKCGLKIERDEIQVPHEIIESTASRKNNNKTKTYTLFRDYQDVILTQNYSLIKQTLG